MCGIIGIVYRDSESQPDAAALVRARDRMRHRGPDQEGIALFPGGGFAHRRLSILDAAGGQQPLRSDDNRYLMVYNGEIYNYRDIAADLRQKGYTFRSNCDTEVVLKAYQEYGSACLYMFNGMFAFAIWDKKERSLFLARDRFGKKPLIYCETEDGLLFASELKGVLELAGRKFELESAALDQFYSRGYIMAPQTIFKGISKLLPGTYLRYKDGQAETTRYYDIKKTPVPDRLDDALDTFDYLIRSSISMRFISDVPLGAFLSGGIDSSIICAVAAQEFKGDFHTFSIGFKGGGDLNELPYARMVAKHIGSISHEREIAPEDFAGLIDKVATFYDEPYSNFTSLASYMLAEFTKREVTVAISGQAADELAAGYPGRYNAPYNDELEAINARNSLYSTHIDLARRIKDMAAIWPWRRRRQMYAPAFHRTLDQSSRIVEIERFLSRATGSALDKILYTDIMTSLPDYLIRLEEQMTMAVSLEARNPFLDYRVAEFLFSLPDKWKIDLSSGTPVNKYFLKRYAARHLPEEIVTKRKQGFSPPLEQWIGDNFESVRASIKSASDFHIQYMNPLFMNAIIDRPYQPGIASVYNMMLMSSLWFKHYGNYIKTTDPEPILPAALNSFAPSDGSTLPRWNLLFRDSEPAFDAYCKLIVSQLKRLKAFDNVLEYDCGDGLFLHLAASKGLAATGVCRHRDIPQALTASLSANKYDAGKPAIITEDELLAGIETQDCDGILCPGLPWFLPPPATIRHLAGRLKPGKTMYTVMVSRKGHLPAVSAEMREEQLKPHFKLQAAQPLQCLDFTFELMRFEPGTL